MANESETGGQGQRGSDAPDSRPISVSELLARSREQGDAGAGTPREGRGRRRVGREGSVSVSELTGEIPRVQSAEPATGPDTSRPSDATTRSAPDPTSARPTTGPTTPVGRPAGDTGAFPRSANPVARRYADDRPIADRPTAAPGRGPADGAGPFGERPARPTSSGMPGYAQPATRDFSSSAVAGRMADDANANAVTGIIPVVGDQDSDGLAVVESDDVDLADLSSPSADSADDPGARPTTGFAEVMDDDFEAYRNFEDVEDDEPEPKKRRFGGWRKKKADRTARPAAARRREQLDGSDETAPVPVPPVPAASVFAAPVAPTPGPDATPAPDETPTGGVSDALVDDTHVDDTHVADTGTDIADGDIDTAADHAPTPQTAPPVTGDATATDPSGLGSVPTDRTLDTDDLTSTSVADEAPTPAAEAPAVRSEPVADDPAPTVAAPATDVEASDHPGRELSPVVAWLLIIGQALAGLAVGVGLFWGFTELWKWNVYFALVLAVLVIFGIVTFAHLVRRTKDLTTTLLALGVGLIVTIGPLVLLAT